MCIVDEHVKLPKLSAEDPAEMRIVRPDRLHIKFQGFQIGNGNMADFQLIEWHSGRCRTRSVTCYRDRTIRSELELSSERGTTIVNWAPVSSKKSNGPE